MKLLILIAFLLLAGFFFVILTRWQRNSGRHEHDANCGHDHEHCNHKHDHSHPHHKDGSCCDGKH